MFMYEKCKKFDPENKMLLKAIMNETKPHNVKHLGRKVQNYDDTVWNSERYQVMVECLRCKFTQNKVLKEKLLKTKPQTLYEASPYDKIWGIGLSKKDAAHCDPNNYGQNLLGKALMEIRDELS